MTWPTVASFVGRWWPFGIIAALALLSVHLNNKAVHWHDQYEACSNGRVADKATYKAAAAQAADNNKATVLATERKWQTVVDNTDKTYNAKLKTANANLAAYISGVQYNQGRKAGADQSGGREAGLSASSFSASGSLGTSAATLIPVPSDDLYICSTNTVKAAQWQDFWNGVTAAQPSE